MSLSQSTKIIKDTLQKFKKATGVPVYHFFCDKKPSAYVVWSEDSPGDPLMGDGRTKAAVVQGTVDYFTKKEKNDADTLAEMLDAEDAIGIISAPYVDYEDDTGYIHYSWTWEVM